MRTCIGCRERAPASELFRFVAVPDAPGRVTLSRAAAGRGAWVHPDPGCIGRAAPRMGRIAGRPAEAGALAADIAQVVRGGLLRRLGPLRRRGAVIVGRAAIRAALAKGEVGALLSAGPAPPWCPPEATLALPVDRVILGTAVDGSPRRLVALSRDRGAGWDRAVAILRALG